MKLSKTVRNMIIASSVVVVIGVLYFNLLLPFWNFLNNELKNPDDSGDPMTSFINIINTPDPLDNPSDGEPSKTIPPAAEGTLNILLLGADEAAGLTDTICIVNIDATAKKINLISVPRDAYVPYDISIKEKMDAAGYAHTRGRFKMNFVTHVGSHIIEYPYGQFENKGVNLLCDIIESMLGYKIDEYAHVNFDGFMQIVDLFGGIKVTAPENIYDSKGELMVKKGLNIMDGKTALFYARARYRYDEFGHQLPSPGDSYRKENQLNMMVEVSKQIITPENITRASEILNSLRANLHHSITVSDISKYTSLALDYTSSNYTIETHVIKGKPFFPQDDSSVEYINLNG